MRTLVAATLILAAGQVRADWQYTRWGMTPNEVKAAARGAARSLQRSDQGGSDLRTLLEAPYEGSGIKFRAEFLFNARTHRLTGVGLHPKDVAQCGFLRSSLWALYGKPETIFPGGRISWVDLGNHNSIGFVGRPSECFVEYLAWGNGAKGGL